ncbi:hypothetical protein [Marinovum sp.]|uniref:hypothetical protein n=1 Tax=Marinovum sp. TaxID=2024839 RepID=UPI002B27B729|nr:hypothetical protein [Marinovum sp.]
MDLLFALEDSGAGMLVSSTQWGYAIVLSLHAVGMAIMVGISLMLIFRVLGFGQKVPLGSLADYWKVALLGFLVNIASGTMLFLGSASELFFNWAFRIKIALVLIGVVLTWRLVSYCYKPAARSDTVYVDASDRRLAVAALLVWLAALIAGRLIGYLN